jgi:predicted short-subunit dehydrogenase-like oxidoreductase (DUF2520 family)
LRNRKQEMQSRSKESEMKKTLNIIGGGKVGRVLGRLFAAHEVFLLQDVLNRSQASAEAAVAFMAAGTALNDLSQMRAADVTLLAVPDDQIAGCCAQLLQHRLTRPGCIVFHCSGALSSEVLQPAVQFGAAVASVHPVRSFADPEQVAAHFGDTFCSLEGSPAALDVLTPALSAIGARLIPIQASAKTLYHAASVIACNYLVTLLDTALQTYRAAGIDDATARQLAEPLVTETVRNVFRLGPEQALTGPIARGDLETVARQQAALDACNPPAGLLYRTLAAATVELAQRKAANAKG